MEVGRKISWTTPLFMPFSCDSAHSKDQGHLHCQDRSVGRPSLFQSCLDGIQESLHAGLVILLHEATKRRSGHEESYDILQREISRHEKVRFCLVVRLGRDIIRDREKRKVEAISIPNDLPLLRDIRLKKVIKTPLDDTVNRFGGGFQPCVSPDCNHTSRSCHTLDFNKKLWNVEPMNSIRDCDEVEVVRWERCGLRDTDRVDHLWMRKRMSNLLR
mmetsp:Transcript_6983/g.14474  ORF Transcript_6983/g.14474 Transcript_6983/m.14474 type:complete len:216 (+) Transcript_6983:1077-1724(+)